MFEMPVQDIIVAKLMTRPLKSNQIQAILQEHIDPNYNHVRTRAYMRALESKLAEEGLLIESSHKGYFIPQTQEEAEEGLRFIRNKAIALFDRYNRRLKLYRKKFPQLKQLELQLKEE